MIGETKNDEPMLSYLLSMFWKNKSLILIFVFVSVVYSYFSIKRQTPIFVAETTLELAKSGSSGVNLSGENNSILSLLGSTSNVAPPEMYKIVSSEFLKGLIKNNQGVQDNLNKYCRYSNPKRLSVPGLIDLFSVHNLREPNVDQTMEYKIDCLRASISIEAFSYKGNATKARVIKVNDPDPFYAAFLANVIANFYISLEKKEREKAHFETLSYLTEALNQAQLNSEKARKALEKFYLINPAFTTNTKLGELNEVDRTNEQVKSLGGLEEQVNLIKSCELVLSSIINENYFYTLGRLNEPKCQSIFSNKFLLSLRAVDASGNSKELKFNRIKEQIDVELQRLKIITISIESEISDKEKSAFKYFELRDQLGDLQEDNAVKREIYQTTQKTILEKKLEGGSIYKNSTAVLSQAIPPLIPSKPNPLLIILANIVIFGFLGLLFIFFKQFQSEYIYHKSQLYKFFNEKNIAVLGRLTNFNFKKLLSSTASIEHSFEFQSILENFRGNRIISVIDLSEKQRKAWISDYLSILFGRSQKNNLEGSLCFLKNRMHFGNAKSLSGSQILYEIGKGQEISVLPEKIAISISQSESFEKDLEELLDKKYQRFENIFISLDGNYDLKTLEKALLICDKYVLAGELGRTKSTNFNKFIVQKELEEKCAGIILVN